MYGIIHRVVRQMVLDRSDEATWARIAAKAGIDGSAMISIQAYDDALTFRLLRISADCLGLDLTTFLTDLGRYWIRHVGQGATGGILRFTGQDIVTLLANLERMHGSIARVLPETRMPILRLTRDVPGNLLVRYVQGREGFDPFIRGMLLGLLDHFGLQGDVVALSNNDAVEFRVTYNGGEAA